MELSRRRKKKRKRKNEEEEEDKNVVGGGVGMKKKERSREKHKKKKKKKGKLVDLTTHKPWVPQSPKIYIHATELCISIFENIIFLFCVSITLTQNL